MGLFDSLDLDLEEVVMGCDCDTSNYDECCKYAESKVNEALARGGYKTTAAIDPASILALINMIIAAIQKCRESKLDRIMARSARNPNQARKFAARIASMQGISYECSLCFLTGAAAMYESEKSKIDELRRT